ncbi:MAG: TlyA family RNA methyltransferase [Candidatus Aminicenantes bacterium]|nr:TlyA family RNA methyltransferase [Candidatus Aminicenantes bacterium]
MKDRADKILVTKGFAESRHKAQALIMAGLVFSGGERVAKAGQLIQVDREIFLKERMPYVSRGGLKLKEALTAFQIPMKGKIAADLGASTGGFTDCLLKEGAEKVYAVDVDTRQLDVHLRQDARVVLIEKNARYIEKNDFKDSLDVVVIDLAFISVLKVLPAVKEIIGKGRLIALIKPQFEVGKGRVGRKGIIKDRAMHEEVLKRIVREARIISFAPLGIMKPSVLGQKGNQEFFIHWIPGEEPLDSIRVAHLIKEAVWDEHD